MKRNERELAEMVQREVRTQVLQELKIQGRYDSEDLAELEKDIIHVNSNIYKLNKQVKRAEIISLITLAVAVILLVMLLFY